MTTCLLRSTLNILLKSWRLYWDFTSGITSVFLWCQKEAGRVDLLIMVMYMNAFAQSLHTLDSVYHGALRFINNSGFLTHHCILYSKVNWTALSTRWLAHWYIFFYKAILGLFLDCLSCLLILKDGLRSLRSSDIVQYVVPKVRTELGKKAFRISAPFGINYRLILNCKT